MGERRRDYTACSCLIRLTWTWSDHLRFYRLSQQRATCAAGGVYRCFEWPPSYLKVLIIHHIVWWETYSCIHRTGKAYTASSTRANPLKRPIKTISHVIMSKVKHFIFSFYVFVPCGKTNAHAKCKVGLLWQCIKSDDVVLHTNIFPFNKMMTQLYLIQDSSFAMRKTGSKKKLKKSSGSCFPKSF